MNRYSGLLNLSGYFYSNGFDYFYYFFILIILGFFWIFISKPRRLNLYLYLVHAIFGSLFLFYTKNFQSDAFRFYMIGSPDICSNIFGPGIARSSNFTYCVTGLTKLIINNYGFSTGIFSFIGFSGINIFFNFLKKIASNTKDKFNALLFFSIPSISFWTAGIGKDSLMILFYSLIFRFISDDYLKEISNKSLSKKRRFFNLIYLILGFLGSYLTRTYTLYILAISLFFAKTKDILNLIFNLRSRKSQLLLIPMIILLIFFGYSLIFDVLNFTNAKITSSNFNLLNQRALLSQNTAMDSGGSYVNQQGLLKLLFIIGGPLSIKNVNFILESFLGLVFITLFYLIFKNINILKKYLIKLNSLILFLGTLTVLELIKLYVFAYNVGIITRQRINPFIFVFIIFFIIKSSKSHTKISQ